MSEQAHGLESGSSPPRSRPDFSLYFRHQTASDARRRPSKKKPKKYRVRLPYTIREQLQRVKRAASARSEGGAEAARGSDSNRWKGPLMIHSDMPTQQQYQEDFDRPVTTRGFTAALWLVAQGYNVLRVEPARDGSGGAVYVFSPAAQDAIRAYHVAKEDLDAKRREALLGTQR